jgi:predicted DNA-binding transcriptional regulator AlpA
MGTGAKRDKSCPQRELKVTDKLSDRIAYPPRAFRAERAAAYLAMGKSKFLELAEEGRLPPPVRIDGVTTWDRLELDAAYERMKNEETEARRNPIEEHYGIGAER